MSVQYYKFRACVFKFHLVIGKKVALTAFHCLCVKQDSKNERQRERHSVCMHESLDMLCYFMLKVNTYINWHKNTSVYIYIYIYIYTAICYLNLNSVCGHFPKVLMTSIRNQQLWASLVLHAAHRYLVSAQKFRFINNFFSWGGIKCRIQEVTIALSGK